MRSFKLTLSSLVLLLLLCAVAPAQGSPTYSQYGTEAGEYCPTDTANDQTLSVKDGTCAAANNVGQGTEAVNDALAEPASSISSASASSSATSISGESVLAGDDAEVDAASSSSASGSSASGSFGTGGSESGSVAAGDSEAAEIASEEGLSSITELPETGGPPHATLISGVPLVTLGLTARRLAL